jgi:replicative DNA helicase
MTAPMSPAPSTHQRLLGPAFDLVTGLALVGAPPAVGKTCVSLNLAVHYCCYLGEGVLYFSPVTPREVILARLAKNLAKEGASVDLGIVADLPLCVLDSPSPTSAEILAAASSYVEQHGQPGLVLVNDLQNLRPGKEGLSGVAAAVEVMADLRGVSKVCDAPLFLFSQLAEGKSISGTVREQADRVVTVSVEREDPDHKYLQVSWADFPEPESEAYALALMRATGVLRPHG